MLISDPRVDLAEDTADWTTLLLRACSADGDDPSGVYGALLGVRSWGARLGSTGKSFRISRPSGCSEAEWELERAWLVPHKEAIVALLATLKTEEEGW